MDPFMDEVGECHLMNLLRNECGGSNLIDPFKGESEGST